MRAQSSYTEPLDHELVVIDNDDDDKVNDTKTTLGQLDAILQDKDEYLNLVSQQGELAQSLLDVLQSVSRPVSVFLIPSSIVQAFELSPSIPSTSVVDPESNSKAFSTVKSLPSVLDNREC